MTGRLADDPADRRKTEAGALADRLRREERFEDVFLASRVHAGPGVADGEDHEGPGRHIEVLEGVRLVG